MSLINLFIGARNAWQGWRKRRRAFDELMALDDRSLADIGIHRSQIPSLVEGFQGPGRAAKLPSAVIASAFGPGHAKLAGGDD
jgi:uncharacterized protein YjiS (DUF1127 family)